MQIKKWDIVQIVASLILITFLLSIMYMEWRGESYLLYVNYYSLLLFYLIPLELVNLALNYIIKTKNIPLTRSIIFLLTTIFLTGVLFIRNFININTPLYFHLFVVITIGTALLIFWILNRLICGIKIRVSLLFLILLLILILVPKNILHESLFFQVFQQSYYKITGKIIIKQFMVCPIPTHGYSDGPQPIDNPCLEETLPNCELVKWVWITPELEGDKTVKEINCSHDGNWKQNAIIFECSYGCPK